MRLILRATLRLQILHLPLPEGIEGLGHRLRARHYRALLANTGSEVQQTRVLKRAAITAPRQTAGALHHAPLQRTRTLSK